MRFENDIWIYLAPICPLDPRPFSKHHRIQSFGFQGVYDTSCVMIATIIQMAIVEGSMIPIDQQTKHFLRSEQNDAVPFMSHLNLPDHIKNE